MKLKKCIKRSYVGVAGSCGILGLMTVAMICPVTPHGANAETKVALNIDARSVISLSLQSNISFDVTPTVDGQFGAGSAGVIVNTNNSSGYALYMKTDNGEDTLKNATGATINPVEGTKAPEEFSKNTWGYAFGDGNLDIDTASYQAVPTTTSEAIHTTGTAGENDTYTLAFGTNISTSIPSGQYSNTIAVSAIANPELVTSLSQLTSMQEMTSSICDTTPEHIEKQLIDDRDGNEYFVTKMKDGNCWMTQNLMLDIGADKDGDGQPDPVIAANTNGSSFVWSRDGFNNNTTEADSDNNKPTMYETAVPTQISGGGKQTATRSWDLGKYVLSNPEGGDSCTVEASKNETMAKCTRFVDVSGNEWKPTYQAQVVDGTLMALDQTAKTYDPHYLIGNYYQFNTATAGTGALVTGDGDQAAASICPTGADSDRNWELPLSGSTYNNTSGSFYNLLVKYGAATLASDDTDPANTAGAAVNNQAAAKAIVKKPLAYVRGGRTDIRGGVQDNAGYNGYGWSRVSVSDTYGYGLGMSAANVYPSNNYSRFFGYPLRCIYLGH